MAGYSLEHLTYEDQSLEEHWKHIKQTVPFDWAKVEQHQIWKPIPASILSKVLSKSVDICGYDLPRNLRPQCSSWLQHMIQPVPKSCTWMSFEYQGPKKKTIQRTNQPNTPKIQRKGIPQDFRLVLPGRIYHTHSASIRRRSLSRSSCSFTAFLILRRKNRITLSDLSHPQVTNASQYQKNMGLFQPSPTKPNQFLPKIASTNPFQSSLVSLNPQMVKNPQNQIPESNHPMKIVKRNPPGLSSQLVSTLQISLI